MKRLNFALLSISCLALIGCESVSNTLSGMRDKPVPGTVEKQSQFTDELVKKGGCPETEIVQELSGYSDFVSTQYLAEDQLISRAHISAIDSTCSYNPRSVQVDLKLTFEGTVGPMGQGRSEYTYPFFVAITGPGGKILAKEVFSASMDYSGGSYKTYQENMRQIIPLSDPEKGMQHKILIGFQLGPEQLDYNRKILMQQQIPEPVQDISVEPVESVPVPTTPQTTQPTGAPEPLISIERTTP